MALINLVMNIINILFHPCTPQICHLYQPIAIPNHSTDAIHVRLQALTSTIMSFVLFLLLTSATHTINGLTWSTETINRLPLPVSNMITGHSTDTSYKGIFLIGMYIQECIITTKQPNHKQEDIAF